MHKPLKEPLLRVLIFIRVKETALYSFIRSGLEASEIIEFCKVWLVASKRKNYELYTQTDKSLTCVYSCVKY